MIVVATKLDATTDRTRLEKLRDFCAQRGLEFHSVSSASGAGIPELVRGMADAVERLKPTEPVSADAACTKRRSTADTGAASHAEDR